MTEAAIEQAREQQLAERVEKFCAAVQLAGIADTLDVPHGSAGGLNLEGKGS